MRYPDAFGYSDAFDADPRGGGRQAGGSLGGTQYNGAGYGGARSTGAFTNDAYSGGARHGSARSGNARYNDALYTTGEQRAPWDEDDHSDLRASDFPAGNFATSDFPTQTDGVPVQSDGFAGQADNFPHTRRATLDGRLYGVTDEDEDAAEGRRGRGLLAGAVSGFLAAGTALGVANLTAAFVRPQASPIIAVGGAFIDRTPPALKNFAVQKFGENDKTMLLLGMYVTIALLALVIGMIAWRYLPVGIVGIGLFGAFGAFVAYTRPESRVTDVIPSLVGGVVAVAALIALNSWTRVRQRPGAGAGDAGRLATERSGWAL
jgi:hypothetical protein